MRFDLKRLYDLLPANLRTKDSLVGLEMLGKNPEDWNDDIYGPIKALLSIIADEAVSIEENIDQLYDDMFIETCSEWVVPYIGDLIGYRGLSRIPNAKYNNRAEVANTITYRRKKGTISVVEQLANDVTGWKASVVEYFMHLATSQYMNHIRPNNVSISKINGPNWQQLAFANTPFDPMPKCVDVRNIQSNRGKYNIPNIGIFLWRIRSYSVTNRPPFMVNDKQYKFDFLGKDIPLYNLSTPEDSFSSMANRENISLPINRREMFEKKDDFYGNGKSVTIYYDGVEINAENVCVCILGNEDGAWINLPIEASKVAIDPLLGRIAFSENKDASKIRVSYHYGYAGDIGSGEFERDQFFEAPALEINETNDFDTSLGDVLSSAKELIISDSSVYKKSNTPLEVTEKLIVRSKNGANAVINCEGDFIFNCNETVGNKIDLILDGLLIDADNIVINGKLSNLIIRNCTINPVRTKLRINSTTTILIEQSIIGQIIFSVDGNLEIKDSIVDSGSYKSNAIENAGKLTIENSTLIGGVTTDIVELASNTIFYVDGTNSKVKVNRLQEGCVRYCYFPEDSELPTPYKCQPSLSGNDYIKPHFESLVFGSPHYCMLAQNCAKEISIGADDDSEMGVFHHLYQNQKINNLKTRLNEYMRFGMEAGIFFGS